MKIYIFFKRERERRKRPKKRELTQIGTNKSCPQTTMKDGNKGSKKITGIRSKNVYFNISMKLLIIFLRKYIFDKSVKKGFNYLLAIELSTKLNEDENVESKLLNKEFQQYGINNKQENDAVGKHNCSTSSSKAISDNATTSNEANKSLKMKGNEGKKSLPSNGKENGEFTQENLMRYKIELKYFISIRDN